MCVPELAQLWDQALGMIWLTEHFVLPLAPSSGPPLARLCAGDAQAN